MIDILIPVLGRPQNAAKVSESLMEATESEYWITFICSIGDVEQIKACWDQDGADTVVVGWKPGRADYAKKINTAFRGTSGEWVFQGADDLRFHPGWDTQAIQAARGRFGVVGTNDLRNRAVTKGLHSTHSLFRRDYIEKYGSGTQDDSGLVLTEVYDHNFVDNEFVETAMARRQFVHAKDSVVEHLHPLWRTAEMDPTYEKALRGQEADTQLYRERSTRFYNRRRRRSRSR